MRRGLRWALVACAATPAAAAGQPVRGLHLDVEQRTRFEIMSHRFRLDAPDASRAVVFRTRLRLEIREIVDPLRFVLELQDSRAALTDEPFAARARHVNEHDVLQVHVQLVADRFLGADLPTVLQAGRFTLDLGRRRLVARNGMRNTTNTFDGVLWQLGAEDRWMLHAFVTRPVTIEPDKLDTSTRARHFWGAQYQNRRHDLLNVELYYLGLHEDTTTAARRTLSTVGARLYRTAAPGRLDYEVESVWQTGSTAGRGHRAHFQHGELGYTVGPAWNSRFSAHYDYASGDRDPADGRLGRFDTLFGARRSDLAPTGIYGPFFRSNLHTPGARWAGTPHPVLSLSTTWRAFWLAQARDAWSGSGLQDATGGAGAFLGTHVEATARLRLRIVAVELGYAHFFKGSYLDRVPGSPGTRDSDYFYAELDLRAPLLR